MGTEENSRSAGAPGESRSDRKNYRETHHESGNPELGGHVYTFGVPSQADKYQSEKAKVFRLIIGQCVPAMKHKIEGDTKYPTLVEASDVTGLLQSMKELVYSTHNTQYEYWAMQASMKTLITMTQHDKESLASFSKKFLAQVEATEAMWGKLIPAKLKGQATGTQDAGRDKFLACLFLAGVNRHHYKDVIDELNNDFLLEKVNYRKDVPTMLAMLSNRHGGQKENKCLDAMNDGVPATSSFAQATPNKKKNVTCLTCGKKGHYANECPNKPTPVAAAQVVEDADSNDDEKTEQKYAWYGPIK
jgi:Zinc knuckle